MNDAGSRSERDKDLCLVVVTAGGVRYGFEVENVLEVVPLREVTPLFRLPAHIRGVTNVRGRVLAVSDLSTFLGVARDSSDHKAGVLVRAGEFEVIFTVSEVSQTTWVSTRDLEEVPTTIPEATRPLFRGLVPDDPPVMVLSVEQLFQRPGSWALPSARSGGAG